MVSAVKRKYVQQLLQVIIPGAPMEKCSDSDMSTFFQFSPGAKTLHPWEGEC